MADDDANELADKVQEARTADKFRRRVALGLAVTGMLLAIVSLGGEAATKDTINHNILAANAYAFYQARNLRQDVYAATADLLENLGKDPAAYRARAEREATQKAALLEEAKHHETEREQAQRRDGNFDFGRALYQIAIVLGSVSILASSRMLVALAGGLAFVATLLAVNGFLLLL